MHGAVSVVLAFTALAIWVLAGANRAFWPVWPALGLGIALALHGWIRHGLPAERERALIDRVDVLTRTRSGAVDVHAAELRRIERDLHDGAQARMVSVAMNLGLAEALLDKDPQSLAGLLAESRSSILTALHELRTVMRGIQPPVLADRGLAGAVRALALHLAVPVKVAGESPDWPRRRSSRPSTSRSASAWPTWSSTLVPGGPRSASDIVTACCGWW